MRQQAICHDGVGVVAPTAPRLYICAMYWVVIYGAEPGSRWEMPVSFRDHAAALACAIDTALEFESMRNAPTSISILTPSAERREWSIDALLVTRRLGIA
jgi:hypothetical protein